MKELNVVQMEEINGGDRLVCFGLAVVAAFSFPYGILFALGGMAVAGC